MLSMGVEFRKQGRGLFMTLSARLGKKGGIDAGTGVRRLEHRMGRMAIGTAGDLFRIAEPIVFPVITIHVSAGCHIEDIVAFHHLLITVAFQADFGMEYAVRMEFRVIHRFDIMEIMAIIAGSRILIASPHRLAVDRLPIHRLLVMALNALGNNHALVIFPVPVRVDIGMAIGTFDILLNVHAGIMLGIFLFVTTLAAHLLYFDLTFHVPGKVSELNVATVTTILAVNGRDKRSGGDFIAMAAEAGDRVNGHPLVGLQGTTSKQNHRDRAGHAGNYFQHADPPAKHK